MGRLIGQPELLADDVLVRDDLGDIMLNVVDADIREVVRLILEDGLKVNYVIHPAVTGTVTIRMNRPIPADDMLPLLNSVLNANYAAIVKKDGLYSILPVEQSVVAGSKPSTRTIQDADGTGSGILVAPLRHVDADQIAELLQPFIVEQGAIQLDADRNTLLLTGTADQIATMSELIDMFDVDWMAGMSFGFYPLTAAQPSQLALELAQIFGRDADEDADSNVIRFVPIDRLSALLVITVEGSYLKRAQSWIKRLDKVGEGQGEQIYVYAVQNGRAADLASVLGELFDIESSVVGPDQLLAPELEPIELGSSFRSDDEGSTPDGSGSRREQGLQFDVRGLTGFPLPSIQKELTQGREADSTKIVADEGNNALLIRAAPIDYKKIREALRELDKPPLQVLLEATIAEVRLKDELRYGIQWFFNFGSADITFSNKTTGSVDPKFPGFSGILSSDDVRLVINALDKVSDVQILSSPQLLVLDNQIAQLDVGDEVPIVIQQSQGINTDDARLVNTVELRQTGVILNVTPRVNANGLVVLDILQEVSTVERTVTSGIDSPTIAQRRVRTTVAVTTDQTVALGGLIQDKVESGRSGIPVLSTIPVVGWLFGATSETTDRTELLILITPKVLTTPQAAVAATDELRRRLRAIAPLEINFGERFAPAESDGSLKSSLGSDAEQQAMPLSGERYFVIQLASLPTEADAMKAWQAYKRAHQEALEGLEHRIERYEREGKIGVSLRAGPISDFDLADRLCKQLKAEGTDCLVVEKR